MELIKLLIGFIKDVFVPIGAYILGKRTKELDNAKSTVDKLQKYEDIENKDISINEVYDSKEWK